MSGKRARRGLRFHALPKAALARRVLQLHTRGKRGMCRACGTPYPCEQRTDASTEHPAA